MRSTRRPDVMSTPASVSRGRATSPFYLDERLSPPESTCRFPDDGLGHETRQEGFYVLAIRRRGYQGYLYRFSQHDRAAAHAMLQTLNRSARKRAPSSVRVPVASSGEAPARCLDRGRRREQRRVADAPQATQHEAVRGFSS